ncbi:MAG: ParB N-terminal domain-containing protein [Bauldia sp.]
MTAQPDLDPRNRKLAVTHRPVAALIPYARNARTHSDKQVAEIAASIRAFGWTNPVLVDGDNGIIAGHGRVLAARKLGMAKVPVIELAGLSDAEKRAYIIADNQLALNAGWDEAMLAVEIGDLQALGFDLALTGFELGEIEGLLAGEASSFPDEAPEPPADPVTVPGDIWTMGPHRLVCGDATDPEMVSLALDGGLADMVFTDPPYNVAYEGKGRARRPIANDHLGNNFGAFLERACRTMLPATKGAGQRRQVEAMAGYGIPEVDIACVLEIDPKTLRRHYRKELAKGHIKATAKVAENLFRKATGEGRESVIAAIFWLKTRAGWKETSVTELAAKDKEPITIITRTIYDGGPHQEAPGSTTVLPVRRFPVIEHESRR